MAYREVSEGVLRVFGDLSSLDDVMLRPVSYPLG